MRHRCEECGKTVDVDTGKCPYCGGELIPNLIGNKFLIGFIIVIVIAMAGVFIALRIYQEGNLQ